jgi:hypothetical protein
MGNAVKPHILIEEATGAGLERITCAPCKDGCPREQFEAVAQDVAREGGRISNRTMDCFTAFVGGRLRFYLLTWMAVGAVACSLTGCASVEHDAQRTAATKLERRYYAQRDELLRESAIIRDLGSDPKMVEKLQAKSKRIEAEFKAERAKLAERVLASR